MNRRNVATIALSLLLIPGGLLANSTGDSPTSVIEWPMEEKHYARAELESRSGSTATGAVDFARSPRGGGLLIRVQVANTTPGLHGVHLHQNATCGAPDSKAEEAGSHWNPTDQPHGGPKDTAHHLGDMGNVLVGPDGKGTEIFRVSEQREAEFGGWDALVGTSVVVHASGDDLITQPSGNSGDRIACGVVHKVH